MGTGGVFLRKLRAKVSDQPTGFIWVEGKAIAASGLPASRRQLAWLSEAGIRSILTLTEGPIPEEWKKGLNVTFLHVPMNDHEPPGFESLDAAVSFVQSEVRGGRPVLVHCLAGQGRTMCVLAGYLIKGKGMDPAEAIRSLRAKRPGAVEGSQEKAVFNYATKVRGNSPSLP